MNVSSYEQLHEVVFSSIAQENSVCVFPNESVRRFWINEYALKSEKGALILDRVLPWDTFIKTFIEDDNLSPCDETIRYVFVRDLIERNGSNLRYFQQPLFPQMQSNLTSSIVSLITHFPAIQRVRGEDEKEYLSLPSSYRHDIEYIEREYLKFLQKHSLSDSHCMSKCECRNETIRGSKVHLFFPHLCTSYQEYEKVIQLLPDVRIYQFALDQTMNITRYGNERIELQSTLQQIKELIANGIHHSEIALSVGSLSRWRPYIELEAQLIPLNLQIVSGSSIYETNVGKLFDSLKKVYQGNFDIEVVRSFLLERSIPWRYRSLHEKIVKRALELHIHQRRAYQQENNWRATLKSSFKEDNKYYFYIHRLFQIISGLIEAESVSDIVRYLSLLRTKFFLEGSWSYNPDREFQSEENQAYTFCLETLKGLGNTLSLFPMSEKIKPYSLFLQLLKNKKFNVTGKPEGLRVYEYQHGVGIAPLYHFFIGCTAEAVENGMRSLPLINHTSFDEDASDTILSSYMMSGKHMIFSYSPKGFTNTTSMLPRLFYEGGEVKEGVGHVTTLMSEELVAWKEGKKESGVHFTPLQQRGFEYASNTIFQEKEIDFASHKQSVSLLPYVANSNNLVPLSSSTLDMFNQCPMKYVSSKVFSIRKNEYQEILIDHGEVGSIEHAIYAQFFQQVNDSFHTFDESHSDEIFTILEEITKEQVNKRLRWSLHLESHVIQYIEHRYLSHLPSIINEELKVFPSNRSCAIELSLHFDDSEKGYSLEGRLDRVLESVDGKVAIVDYKKSHVMAKKEFSLDSPKLTSYQLPLYVSLIERSKDSPFSQVDIGSYYNIEKGSYTIAWDDNSDLVEHLKQLSNECIEEMVDKIRSGFMGATPSKKVCEYCDYRQVCRRRYSLP